MSRENDLTKWLVVIPQLQNQLDFLYTDDKKTKEWEDKMPTTGEKPGKGTYYCTNCGQAVTLDDDTDTLPPCPKCDGTNFR